MKILDIDVKFLSRPFSVRQLVPADNAAKWLCNRTVKISQWKAVRAVGSMYNKIFLSNVIISTKYKYIEIDRHSAQYFPLTWFSTVFGVFFKCSAYFSCLAIFVLYKSRLVVNLFFFLITPITWFDNLFTEETKRKTLNENTAAPSSLLFIPSCNFNIGTTSPWYYFNNYTAS